MVDLVALSPTTPHLRARRRRRRLLTRVDVAATTDGVYRASLAALVHGLGPARAMPELTAELVDDWFRARYATVAPATWNRELVSCA